MPEGEGHLPPSEGRIAAAYRDGRFPRSGILASGVSLLLVAGALFWFGEPLLAAALDLPRRGLSDALSRSGSVDGMVSGFKAAAWILWPFFLLVLVGGGAFGVLPAIIARRKQGRTAVPLPSRAPSRLPRIALRLFGSLVFVLLALGIVRGLPPASDPLSLLSSLGRGMCRIAAAAGGILVLLGLAELILTRHAVWRSLFLDSAESRREERHQRGDPRVRRERRRRTRSTGP